MSSDIVQHRFLKVEKPQVVDEDSLELSRAQGFVNGDEDIFDVLARKRSMDTQIDMINATKNKIFISRQRRLLKGLLNV